ncbi:MAG: hypothetical protein AAGF47_05765 [Planctomycetota bacterium]
MIMNLLAIAIVLGVGYAWVTRGFFSALLNMICVIAGGAIAFAAWESVALFLIDTAPSNFLRFIGDAAWGLGLAIPFALAVALLRVATDSLIRANLAVDDAMNYVGGGVCGAVSGVITAGLIVTSIGFLRVPQSFLGYQPVAVVAQGNFETQQNLWVPVDRLTAQLYRHLSVNTLSSGTPMARYVPDLVAAAGTQRMTAGKGKNRNTISPDAFEVTGWFTVGRDSGAPEAIFSDFIDARPQTITDLAGNPVSNAYSAGFIVRFDAGAREDFGQIVASKGQFRLVVENDTDGSTKTVFPIAVTTQASAGDDAYGRFRFTTAGDDIASVGGSADATMAFEFPVERGYSPLALYVRNVRHLVDAEPTSTFPDGASRDLAIQTNTLVGGTRAENLNTAFATTAASGTNGAPGMSVSVRIPRQYALQDGQTRGMRTNDSKQVISGEEQFEPGFLGARVDAVLRVDQFFVTPDTNIAQVTVTGDPAQIPSSLFGTAWTEIDPAESVRIVDSSGQIYPAIGYIYEDRSIVSMRYSPSRPLRTLQDAPQLSRTRDDQQLILLFRVSRDVDLQHFAIGDIVVTTYEPAITVPAPRFRNR